MGDRINIFVETKEGADKEEIRDEALDKIGEIDGVDSAEADFGFFKPKKRRYYDHEEKMKVVTKKVFEDIYGTD